MTAKRQAQAAPGTPTNHEVRVEDLLGQPVLAMNNQRIGRLEEFRTEERGGDCVITHYVIGVAGLFERLDVGMKLLLGWKGSGYLARWDQLDISDTHHLRLICPLEELRRL
jgi:hypothetical protein